MERARKFLFNPLNEKLLLKAKRFVLTSQTSSGKPFSPGVVGEQLCQFLL